MKLAKQEQKVFHYIRDKRGCTTRDIQRDLLIECPSARITGCATKGWRSGRIGQKKYPGSRPFVMYAVNDIKPRYAYEFDPVKGVVMERRM